MSASATMPYFINPSKALSKVEKEAAYQEAIRGINANLEDIDNPITKMVTINCLLKTFLPYYYWVGFYLVENERLIVGPYQGTLGCIYIDFGRGVCGKAAAEKQTQVVADVHALEQGNAHIACDPNSASEIVVPVLDAKGDLLAVFDVDSTLANSFDVVDQTYLEKLMSVHFAG